MVRLIVVFMMMCVVGPSLAFASSSLTFEGGGYEIEMVVGSGDHGEPIMIEKFFLPEDTKGVGINIPAKDVRVEKFDIPHQRLELEFVQPEKGKKPESFALSVDHDAAVLKIDGHEITSSFDWDM